MGIGSLCRSDNRRVDHNPLTVLDEVFGYADFRGLHKLKQAAGKRFTKGIVLYDGEISASFGEGFYAVPIRRLWEVA